MQSSTREASQVSPEPYEANEKASDSVAMDEIKTID